MSYEVKAYKKPQGVVRLQYEVASPAEALARAQSDGYRVISCKAQATLPKLTPRYRYPLALFSQELLSLLDAGLPLLESIETLAHKERSLQAREINAGLVRLLREGLPLSQAMREFPAAFPQLYVATIQASERTGDLQQALARYLAYHTQLDTVRKKVVNAVIYPVLLLAVGGLVILFLMFYVVPRFGRIYGDLGRDLPLMSRILMEWGRFFDAYAAEVILFGILALAGSVYVLSRNKTRDWLQQRIWRIPAIGAHLRLYQLARLYRTLGMLLDGGIPVVVSLDMLSGLLLQPSMRANLHYARQLVSEGHTVSESMEKCALTTEVACRMLRVGERSGNLGEMAERVAKFYDEEIARWLEWFVRLFEPILMIFIGLVIGGIILLMYLPVFELAGSL